MFYLASKLVAFFITPSNLLVGLGLLGVVLVPTRFARAGRRLLVTSVLLIATVGVLPLWVALTFPLENRFPLWDASRGAPDGIVVIGGVINSRISEVRGQVALDEAAERVIAAVELARRYPAAAIVFSGGYGELFAHGSDEARFAGRLWESLGVAAHRIVLEKRSRNTAENAVFTKQLVAPKPSEHWLLITSAMHMPRAIGAFRKTGFPIDAYPVDYQTAGLEDLWTISSSFTAGIGKTDAAVHEWLGLLVYWITGRISVPLPGPMSEIPLPARQYA